MREMKMTEWQPIETCPESQHVLLYWRHWCVDAVTGWRFKNWFYSDDAKIAINGELSAENCPTHWAPLPNPPIGE